MKVVLTAYRRPDYLRQTLAAWARVRGLVDMTVHVDPSDRTDDVLDVVRDAEKDWRETSPRSRLDVNVAPERRGVLDAPFYALDHKFAGGEPYVVLAEEDVLPSVDLVEWHEFAAAQFAAQSTLAVCSHSWARVAPLDAYETGGLFSPLIWGTWADRWRKLIRPTWDHDYSTNNGEPGTEAGWDWNLGRVARQHGRDFARPSASRSQHIGREDGQHCTADLFPATVTESFVEHWTDPGHGWTWRAADPRNVAQ